MSESGNDKIEAAPVQPKAPDVTQFPGARAELTAVLAPGQAQAEVVDPPRELSPEDLDVSMFPEAMRELVLSIRRLNHVEYVALVDACKGTPMGHHGLLKPAERAALDILEVAVQLRAANVPAGTETERDTRVRAAADVMRLLRTERKDEGCNILDRSSGDKEYDPKNELHVLMRAYDATYHFRVQPAAAGRSRVVSSFGELPLEEGQTVTLGRGPLNLRETFGLYFEEPRIADCDLLVAEMTDTNFPRACIKVRRTEDGIEVLEIGATSVNQVTVRVLHPVSKIEIGMSHYVPLNRQVVTNVPARRKEEDEDA